MMDDFTPEQQKIFKEFKERYEDKVPEHMKNDLQLSKWLLVRNFHFDKAEDMLTKSLEWRKKWGIDSLDDYEPPEVLKRYLTYGSVGYDKRGAHLIIAPIGNIDVTGIVESSTREDRIKTTFKILEDSLKETRRMAQERNVVIDKNIIIFDMENFSIRPFAYKPVLNFVVELLKYYEANYPETLRYAFVINAPMLFSLAYNFVKQFLHENTIKKIKVYGYSGWKDDILEEVDPDQLPVHWGGNLTDPDGNTKCVSRINVGEVVPKEFYLSEDNLNEKNKNLNVDFKDNISLSKKESKVFEFDVNKPESKLRWEFRSKGNDIGFEVFRAASSSKEKDEIVPLQRVNSLLFKEEGSFLCDEEGLYKISFKNEYSDKDVEVFYNVDFQAP